MTCIKVGSDESHFNVSLIVRDKITRQCPQTTTFSRERRAEAVLNQGPSAYQPTALPLGQTSSLENTAKLKPVLSELPSNNGRELCRFLYKGLTFQLTRI